jgi:predicted acylesterase/phospholipase RssA
MRWLRLVRRCTLGALGAALMLASGASGASGQAEHAFVLSGGGARGLAHAGALVALEELGYHASLVVGTSMGSIIGALYAAGYEPHEIHDIVGEENWLERFAGPPLVLGAERTARRPLLRVGLGTRRLPEGLLPGTGVNRRLVELLFDAGVRARNDFDHLPRRFRAVAADLSTGAEVVLGAGDLPRAVRASMAVPGVFAPVPWDSRILTDGGVANNLPVSVARGLTDLPIIAVDVVRPLPDMPERGALDIGVRALRLLIENATPAAVPGAEILVLPRVQPGLSEGWFPADPGRVLRAGYDAVIEHVPPLPRPAPPVPARRAAPAHIGAVEVVGGDPALRRLVHRVLRPAVGPYDGEAVITRTSALYRTGLFDAIWPRLDFPDGDDAPATLVVELTPINRTSVAAAARWDNDVGGGVWASLRHLLSLGSPLELRAAALLDELSHSASGEGALFSTLLPGVAWIGGVRGSETRIRLFGGDSLPGREAVRRAGGWIGAEYHAGWLVSLLGRTDYVQDEKRDAAGWSAGPVLRLARSPAPDAIVGMDPLLEAEARFGAVPYRRVHARGGAAAGRGRLQAVGFLDVASTSDGAPRDVLPGATRELAPWLEAGMLRASTRAVAGLDFAWPLILNGYGRARLRAYGATSADPREPAGLDRAAAWRTGAELGAAWPSVVGIIEVGVARGGGGGGWRTNVGIGPRF